MAGVKWKKQPEQHDYPAAGQYLSLLVGNEALRERLIGQLEAAPLVSYLAKDLLRASSLPLLGRDNAHVARDLKKIRKGERLSPVLLVRGDLVRGFALQIADGYHRVCASLLVDEDTVVPCRLIDLPRPTPVRRPTKAVEPPAPAVEVPVSLPVQKSAAAKKAPAQQTGPATKAAAAATTRARRPAARKSTTAH